MVCDTWYTLLQKQESVVFIAFHKMEQNEMQYICEQKGPPTKSKSLREKKKESGWVITEILYIFHHIQTLHLDLNSAR